MGVLIHADSEQQRPEHVSEFHARRQSLEAIWEDEMATFYLRNLKYHAENTWKNVENNVIKSILQEEKSLYNQKKNRFNR